MCVIDLLKELPGDNTKANTWFGFSKLAVLDRFPASIGTGGLVFLCAHRHKEAYNSGDYLPAAREFQRLIITFNLLHRWQYSLVFGGGVIINAEFIGICILICKRHFVKFIVAPAEADMQVGWSSDGVVPVCRDSDPLATW